MKLPKRLHRLISFFLSLTLVFQTFSPAIIYAEEATQSADIQTESLTPSPTETPPVTPTEEVTPEPTPTPEPTSGSDPVVPLWIQVDGNALTTNENVGEGIDYRFRDTNLIVRFTKVTKPGKLTIREVKLTPEQIASSGALSDTAYDITSDMENGSFLYDLTLPLPQDNQNAKVEFASDQNSLDQSVAIDINVTKNPDTIEIKGLDHFTIFFVSGGIDQATHGDMCVLYDCILDADHPSLKSVDSQYLDISSFDASISALWPDSEETIPDGDNYVQFDFSPSLDPDILVQKASLKFVYKTNEIDTSDPEDKPYGAKLVVSSDGFSEEELFIRDVTPDSANPGDQSFSTDLLPEFQNSNDLNNLQVRLYFFGTAVDDPGVTTSFNQVALIVPPPTPELVFPPDGALIKASDAILDWTEVTDVLGESVTYYYRSSWTGGSYPSDFATGVARATSSIDARGSASRTYNWQVRACAGLDNCSDWSGPWIVTIDGTKPTTPGIPSSTPNPTNQLTQNWNWTGSTDALSGVKGYWYSVTGPTPTPWTFLGDVLSTTTSLGEGASEFSVKAEDNAGNQGDVSTGDVTVDRTPPNAPTPLTLVDGVAIKGVAFTQTWTNESVSGAVLYQYQSCFNDPALSPCSQKYTGTFSGTSKFVAAGQPNSHFWWHVKAKDAAGNWSLYGPAYEMTIDNSSPSTILTPYPNKPTNDNTPTYTGTASDNYLAGINLVEYKIVNNETSATVTDWTPANSADGSFDSLVEEFNFTSAPLSDGDYTFYARATDRAGNIESTASDTLTIDTVFPTAEVGYSTTSPTKDDVVATLINSSEPITITSEGGSSHTFTENDSFLFEFTDAAGNPGSVLATVANIDRTRPTTPGTPLTSPNPTNQTSQVWNWSASTDSNGIFQYLWEVIGGSSGTVSNTSLTTNLGEGVWSLSIKAEDNPGNQSLVSTGGVTVDLTGPPAPTITFPGAEQYFRTSPISNRWTAVADPSGIKEYRIEYQYDDGHTFSGAPYRTTTSTSRNHSPGITEQGGVMIRVQALDNAGNYGDWSDWVHYYYDATAPALLSKTTFSGWYREDQVSEFTYTDANGIASGTPVSCIISTEGSAQTCSVTPNVCDAAGNCNTVTVISNGADLDKSDPTVDAGPDQLVNGTFAQEGSGSDIVSGIASYSWSKESGSGNLTFGSPDEPTTTVTADQDGVYEISLTVTDNAGNSTPDTFTLTWDATGPTANITSPANGSYKKSKPTFDVSASDDSGVASVKFQYRLSGTADFTDLNTDTVPSPYRAKWGSVSLATNNVYDLRAIATDTLGNLSMTPIVSFTFDNQLPEILYNNPLGGETVWYNSSPLFDIDFLYDEGGAPLDKAQYRLDGGSYKNIFTADRTSDYTTDWGIASWATLAEGLHQLDIKLIDKAGNTNTDNYVEGVSGLNVGKDLTAPVVTVPENQTLEAEGSEGAPYEFFPTPSASDDSGTSGVTCDYASGETFPIGITTVTCEATDLAGNTGSASFDITVNDTTGPELSLPDDITAEATGPDGAIVTYETSANDLVDGSVEISCSPESGSTFSLGTTTVDCEATDSNDNTTSDSFEVTVEDNIKPTSIITVPGNNGTNSLVYSNSWDGSIFGTASDDSSGLAEVELSIQRATDSAYWNGESWVVLDGEEDEPRVTADGTADWNYTLISPAEDSYEITSHAVDNAGNVEDSYKLTIVFDKTIPEVMIALDPATPDSGNNWYQTEPTITLTTTDNTVTDHIEYQWDATTGTWSVYSLPFKTIDQGSHTLYYRAYDKAGNVSDTGIKNIKYDKTELTNGPQNISVSPNPTSGTTAKVKWDAASDNVGIEKYEINWSLDGTSTSYTDTVGNEVREHEINKLDQEGKWNITVTAFDYAGNRKSGSTELTVDRGAPAAPTLTLGGTGVGTATLTWNSVADANDYIIWYGNVPGTYLYGARTGNVDNFTVRGLGGGDYYFVIQSVDNAGNRSGNSNEVSTLALAGTPGVEPGTPAEGFTPEVQGAETSETPTISVSPTPEVLGETNQNNFPWWLTLLLISSGGYAAWLFLRRR